MENGIFGLSQDFIDNLSESELSALQSAKQTLDTIGQKYNQFCGGVTSEGLKQHIETVRQQQREEADAADRLRARYK